MIKYSYNDQRKLDYHQDWCDFSFIVALNDQFEGGGTTFKNDQKNILKAVTDQYGVEEFNTVVRNYCLGQVLVYVAFSGNVDLLDILLSFSPYLDMKQYAGMKYAWTALGFASEWNHTEVAERLILKGASSMIPNAYFSMPLHEAAKHGRQKEDGHAVSTNLQPT